MNNIRCQIGSIVTFVLLTLIFVLSSTEAIHSQDDSPEFYFYSKENNEFVIGQVDDISYVSLYSYQAQNEFIFGPGWSPSGEWLAWTDDLVGAGSARKNFGAYLTSRNGATRILIENSYQILTMNWASHNDILYITKRDFNTVSNLQDTEIIIYNASDEQLVANYTCFRITRS